MTNDSDIVLMQQVKKGDEVALRVLIDRYRERLYRLALGLLADRSAADDAVQETLARLWHRRLRLGLVKDKRGYCLNALRNECISMLRHRRPTVDINTLADNLPDEPPQAALLAEQRYRQLDQAIQQLTPLQQQLIRLKYVEQHSTKEIAQITGLTPSNIDTIMSRTYAQLRTIIPVARDDKEQ